MRITAGPLLAVVAAFVIATVTIAAQQLPPRAAPDGLSTNRTWTDEDLDKVMKQVGSTATNLRKMIDDKAAPATEAHADTLEHFFGEVEDFFDARNLNDAEGWAEDASDHANQIENAAEGKDFAKAAEHLKLLMATCQTCHTKYRERLPDGSYQLKKQ
jgi:cytochrome c556